MAKPARLPLERVAIDSVYVLPHGELDEQSASCCGVLTGYLDGPMTCNECGARFAISCIRPSYECLAEHAYMAYGEVTNFQNFQGNPMPSWEQLPAVIQQAWMAAVKSVYVSD